VCDTATLRAAHSGRDALPEDIDAADLPDIADLGPELTRGFRGIRKRLPLHLSGARTRPWCLTSGFKLLSRSR
jgi:aromatic-L-amino-acid decarboxylase